MPFAFKPAVRLNLDGPGGNIFAVVGGCAAAARKCGLPREQIEEFTRAAMNTESYGAALAVVREWFDMGDDE